MGESEESEGSGRAAVRVERVHLGRALPEYAVAGPVGRREDTWKRTASQAQPYRLIIWSHTRCRLPSVRAGAAFRRELPWAIGNAVRRQLRRSNEHHQIALMTPCSTLFFSDRAGLGVHDDLMLVRAVLHIEGYHRSLHIFPSPAPRM